MGELLSTFPPFLQLAFSFPPFLQLALLAGLVGLQVPWVTLLTCCQLYQVHALALAKEELGMIWPYV